MRRRNRCGGATIPRQNHSPDRKVPNEMIPQQTIQTETLPSGIAGTPEIARGAAHAAFAAWQESSDRLWRMRVRLTAQGDDPAQDDAYLTAWCEHYDRFPEPPAYPGRLADSVRTIFV
jgi:hypothetical protein